MECLSQATIVLAKEAGVIEGTSERSKRYARSSSLLTGSSSLVDWSGGPARRGQPPTLFGQTYWVSRRWEQSYLWHTGIHSHLGDQYTLPHSDTEYWNSHQYRSGKRAQWNLKRGERWHKSKDSPMSIHLRSTKGLHQWLSKHKIILPRR